MLRIIAGVIVGFLIMMVIVMATFAITMMALGMDNILKPGTFWTTDKFNIIVLAGGLIAAIVGGMTCKAIARNSTATFVLMAIVVIMGAGSAYSNMKRPDPPAPPAEFASLKLEEKLELMQKHGKEPNWFAIMKTLVGAAGLLIGSSLVKSRMA